MAKRANLRITQLTKEGEQGVDEVPIIQNRVLDRRNHRLQKLAKIQLELAEFFVVLGERIFVAFLQGNYAQKNTKISAPAYKTGKTQIALNHK